MHNQNIENQAQAKREEERIKKSEGAGRQNVSTPGSSKLGSSTAVNM